MALPVLTHSLNPSPLLNPDLLFPCRRGGRFFYSEKAAEEDMP
jgi:hypothetical protein